MARANKAICIPIVWITNPLTLWPIYGACFALGRLIIASPTTTDETVIISELERQQTVGFFDPAYWKGLFGHLVVMSLELWVGCFLVGSVAAIISYVLFHRGVTAYRERRRQRILRRSLLRSQGMIVGGIRQPESD